ncbi:MAG: hypothetical protein HQ595_04550 [Candidatus Omnitrophica bacterium]|nr:hypothetical protein [Candidatus Omnitrophota bacterium]
MKKIILKNSTEVTGYIDAIMDAANAAQMRLIELSETLDGIQLLEKMKFEKVGYDPLNTERELNLIEQLNQSFTYLASFKAAEILFQRHEGIYELLLNLGVMPGPDIESSDVGGIAAEVFATTKPSSNNKLNKDIVKVASTDATHKYVFFMCPHIKEGPYEEKSTDDVLVWSLGI